MGQRTGAQTAMQTRGTTVRNSKLQADYYAERAKMTADLRAIEHPPPRPSKLLAVPLSDLELNTILAAHAKHLLPTLRIKQVAFILGKPYVWAQMVSSGRSFKHIKPHDYSAYIANLAPSVRQDTESA